MRCVAVCLLVLCLVCGISVCRAQVNYSISGTVAEGATTVFLNTVRNQPVDTVEVRSGHFTFTGQLPQHTFVTVSDDAGNYPVNVIIDGESVDIDMARRTLKGSRMNERFNKTDTEITDLQLDYLLLRSEYAQTQQWKMGRRDTLQRQMNSAYNRLIVCMKNAIRDNADNVIPALYLSQIYNVLEPEELKEYLDGGHAYAAHPLCAGAWRMLNHHEKTNIGQMFTDIAMPDTAGVMHRLSDYAGRGRYVLVDFWASWCMPCMAEMPNVKANYDKYHSLGLDIVGLSFDRGKSPWVNAINRYDMDWIQLSDLKYWESEASIQYGISSIPANLLLDAEGRIIATDLRGADLGSKLKEIFGQ